MPTFIVECYWPAITEEQVRQAMALLGRARNAAGTQGSIGRLGCILLPSDGMAIFLFRAPSALHLSETAHQVGLPFDRIVESIHVGLGEAREELLEGGPTTQRGMRYARRVQSKD
jgi:hypothetical protein